MAPWRTAYAVRFSFSSILTTFHKTSKDLFHLQIAKRTSLWTLLPLECSRLSNLNTCGRKPFLSVSVPSRPMQREECTVCLSYSTPNQGSQGDFRICHLHRNAYSTALFISSGEWPQPPISEENEYCLSWQDSCTGFLESYQSAMYLDFLVEEFGSKSCLPPT